MKYKKFGKMDAIVIDNKELASMVYIPAGRKKAIKLTNVGQMFGKRKKKSNMSNGEWVDVRFKPSPRGKKATDVYVRIGDNIHTLRESMGLTLKELATDAKISMSYLVNIENAQKQPTLYVLERIARVLDVEISKLIGYDVYENPLKDELMIEHMICGLVAGRGYKEKKRIWKLLKKMYRSAEDVERHIKSIPQIRD
jgi:transcriptional regulator with XRE-family HTH domain